MFLVKNNLLKIKKINKYIKEIFRTIIANKNKYIIILILIINIYISIFKL